MLNDGLSAVGAMGVLRRQIEERLLRTEDYRAMRALDRAIAEVQAALAPRSEMAAGSPSVGIAETPAVLQGRVADQFGAVAA